jgi:hypothetical protein
MSMKYSSDTIGNRSHNLPVCSTVPQPLHCRVPQYIHIYLKCMDHGSCKLLYNMLYILWLYPKKHLWYVNKFHPVLFLPLNTLSLLLLLWTTKNNIKARYTQYVRKKMTSIFCNSNLTSYPRSVCCMGTR